MEEQRQEIACLPPPEMSKTEIEAGPATGIDVSNWQGMIDWARVARSGVRHVFMKMSEGATYVDPRFVENWSGAQAAGLSVNCYHFFRALDAPEQQMINIRKNTRGVNFDPDKNALAIDVEKTGNEKATPEQMADSLNALLTLIQIDPVLSRGTVVIYTSYGYWDSGVSWGKYDFGACNLWVAHWEVSAPHLPEPWRREGKSWVWWQYSSMGRVDGIAGDVDLDWVKV